MNSQAEKMPVMTDYDEYLWSQANHHRAYLRMGAHEAEYNGVKGTYFAVWAPNAESVSVIGDFNGWQVGANPLNLRYETGVWGGFVPGIAQGCLYKYAVKPRNGNFVFEKADPYGFASELRPRTASIVWNVNAYSWNDGEWMAKRP
ncbi:1,4-alpha-glucan branching enzyme, partial [bacterium]|nr:1,4-alpha-glucan branching enzyme [bacterium]